MSRYFWSGTLLSLTLKLVDDDELSIEQAINNLSYKPAQILGIDAGHLSLGGVADLCIFNPNAESHCHPDSFISAGKNSPFGGWSFNNEVVYTIHHGNIVYQKG